MIPKGPAVLVVAAVPWEVAPLSERFDRANDLVSGPYRVRVGRIGSVRVGVGVTGAGKANAAMGTALALGAVSAEVVVSVGVAGAYPRSGLALEQVAVASEEVYADEGVESEEGFLDLAAMGLSFGIPGGVPAYGSWPADPAVTEALRAACGAALVGPFATVSTVTGTDERARRVEARTGAVCESMEGAAVAQAAAVYGVPFAEVRGVSNAVGRRDRSAWRLKEAAAAACDAVLAWLHTLERP